MPPSGPDGRPRSYPERVSHPQNQFGQHRGPQFGQPGPAQSTFGGWGGGAPAQWSQPGSFGPPPGTQPAPWPPPGQFGGRPPAPRRRPTWLIGALAAAGFVLIALLAYTIASGGGNSGQVSPQYENEDYRLPTAGDEVPEVVMPNTEAELVEYLEENPLYSVTLPNPVRCELGLDDEVHSMTDDELEERLAGIVGCLTRVWGPTLEEAGFVAYQPEMTVYPAGGTVQTQCGVQESLNAFYCGADQNLYLAADITRVLSPGPANHRMIYDVIISHEYGHALQGRTGIFVSSKYIESQADEPVALEASRRAEVQADCLGSLGIRALAESMGLTDEDRTMIEEIAHDIGDDTLRERFGGDPGEPGNHGTGESRQLWSARGLATDDIGACNTWVAPSTEVE